MDSLSQRGLRHRIRIWQACCYGQRRSPLSGHFIDSAITGCVEKPGSVSLFEELQMRTIGAAIVASSLVVSSAFAATDSAASARSWQAGRREAGADGRQYSASGSRCWRCGGRHRLGRVGQRQWFGDDHYDRHESVSSARHAQEGSRALPVILSSRAGEEFRFRSFPFPG